MVVMLVSTLSAGCRPKVYNDGTYVGISQAQTRFGHAVAEVTVQNDKISAVTLKEITELGVDKDYDTYPYPQARVANTEMAKRFIGRQDAAGVDAVSGATNSSGMYKEAVAHALEKARKTPVVETTYFTGTYFGRSASDDEGYGIAFVSIEDDKIVSVKLDDVMPDGTLKDWPAYTYTKALEAKAEMEKRFVQQNSGAVDTYSGATLSSAKWVQAVAEALKNAKVR